MIIWSSSDEWVRVDESSNREPRRERRRREGVKSRESPGGIPIFKILASISGYQVFRVPHRYYFHNRCWPLIRSTTIPNPNCIHVLYVVRANSLLPTSAGKCTVSKRTYHTSLVRVTWHRDIYLRRCRPSLLKFGYGSQCFFTRTRIRHDTNITKRAITQRNQILDARHQHRRSLFSSSFICTCWHNHQLLWRASLICIISCVCFDVLIQIYY